MKLAHCYSIKSPNHAALFYVMEKYAEENLEVRIDLSSPDVIPLDVAIIRVPTVFSCVETAIGNS